jgi:hypothetical protein
MRPSGVVPPPPRRKIRRTLPSFSHTSPRHGGSTPLSVKDKSADVFCMLLENLLLPLDHLHSDAVELNGLTVTIIIIQAKPIRRQ